MYRIEAAPRHKIFISYHHAGDQIYKDHFLRVFSDAIVDYSVRVGDIPDNAPTEHVRQTIRDEYIRDATVTVVLIGSGTWRRRHVDWEIDSSLRDTRHNPRTGLLGIVLPTYSIPSAQANPLLGTDVPRTSRYHTEPRRSIYWPHNIPPRLWDNVPNYALIRPWPNDPFELQDWVHTAFERRTLNPPPNMSRVRFANNRPESSQFWV